MKKIIKTLILLIIFIIIFILYLIIKVPKNQKNTIIIPLGQTKKINTQNVYKNEIIEIDENGNIKTLKQGKTTIEINNTPYTIEVTEPLLDINTYDENIELTINQEYEISFILKQNIEIVKYEYDNNIIELNNNKIIGLKEGKTTLKAITNKETYKEINIIVKKQYIQLSHQKMNILVGEKIKLSIYSDTKLNNIIYNINNNNIKIENGIVTGLKKGKSIITITINENNYTCEVTVDDTINEFYLNKNFINLKINEEFKIESNIPTNLIKYEYDDKIIKLNSDKIIGLKEGKTLLKATAFNKTYYMTIYIGTYNISYNYEYNKFIKYFDEIALNNEYIITESSKKIQKWNSPIYYNYINASENDIKKIKQIEQQLNKIPGFPGMYYSENNPNLTINFTTYEYLYGITKVQGVEGYSTIDFDENNIIYKSIIYINSNLNDNTKNSVISEELLHSIGLKNDTKTIKNSVLYEYGSIIEELSEYDLLACNLLYSTYINYGMTNTTVENILKEILK